MASYYSKAGKCFFEMKKLTEAVSYFEESKIVHQNIGKEPWERKQELRQIRSVSVYFIRLCCHLVHLFNERKSCAALYSRHRWRQ